MKKTYSTGIFITAVSIFILLGILHKIQVVTTLDMDILLAISKIRTDFLTEVMLFLSYVGSWNVHIWIVGTACLFFIVKKRYSIVVLLIFNLYGARFLNQFLKNIFMRERPSIRIIDIGEYSFPSGHAMNNFALFGFLLFLVLSSNVNKNIKIFTSIIFTFLIVSISFSRLYLAVHYPTDILAGWCGGSIVVLACVYMYKKFHMKI